MSSKSSYKPANPNRTRKKCKYCASGKHSSCTGMSANKEGVICPCCGDLSHDERQKKEQEQRERKANQRYQENYSNYGGCFDGFLRKKMSSAGLDYQSPQAIFDFLPKTKEDLNAWIRESEIPRKWLIFFVEETRQDNSAH
jgi:hypothetical protein